MEGKHWQRTRLRLIRQKSLRLRAHRFTRMRPGEIQEVIGAQPCITFSRSIRLTYAALLFCDAIAATRELCFTARQY